MKRVVLGALALVPVMLIAWLAMRGDPPVGEPRPPVSARLPAPAAPAPMERVAQVVGESPTPSSAAPREAVVAAPDAHAADVGPRAHVFGVLVDENGAPVAGASVRLHSTGDEWSKGFQPPAIDWHGHQASAFEMKSDAQGRFDFDVPLPTADWVSLYVEPDEFHAIDHRDFGPAGGRNRERLKAGDNDLGTFHLANTGAIDGVVRAQDGTAIAKSDVSIHGAFPGGLVIQTRSADDGTYSLGHVPEGTWVLQAKRDGFRSAQSSGVTVEKRTHARGVDFALEKAATISGVVVDEHGDPVGGVRLWAWPASSGQGAGARSAADGTFTLSLPQNDPYRFDFDHPGFDHFGGHASQAYEPGTNGVRIVLAKHGTLDVRVVDAESDAPIERFGIALSVVERDSVQTDEAISVPKLEEHAGGVASVPRERGKIVARVIAPGYASVSVPLAVPATPATPAVQGDVETIRLTKASSVSGRLMLEGAPRAGAKIELTAATIKRDPSRPDEDEDERVFSDNYTRDVAGFAGRKRALESDAEGRFRFDDLAAGHYRLEVRSDTSAPHVVDPVAVGAKQDVDLGDVTLGKGASIHGRIASPPGRELDEWVVTLDREWSMHREESNSSQTFHFDGIEPGRHVLFVRRGRASSDATPLLELELAPGETKDVVLDVSSLLPARVTVRVTRDGRAVEGVRVRGVCEGTRREIPIGAATDAQGEIHGECPPCDAVRFEVISAVDLTLGASASALSVAAGVQLDVDIAIASGRARLEFPAGFVVPPRSMAFVLIDPAESKDGGAKGRGRKLVTCGTSDQPMHARIEWKDRTIDLGEIAPGEYDVSANVQQQGDGPNAVPTSRPTASAYRGKLVVKQGELALCELAPNEPRK